MPAGFDKCKAEGGRVRTITASDPLGKKFGLSKSQYMHVCFMGGEMHKGYVKTKGVKRPGSMMAKKHEGEMKKM